MPGADAVSVSKGLRLLVDQVTSNKFSLEKLKMVLTVLVSVKACSQMRAFFPLNY